MKKWYVVHIKPNQELTAEQQLKNQNFEVFYPRCIQQVHNPNTDRITKRVSPLFPGYMFVSFDIAEPCGWQKIPNTRGVLNLIGMKESSVLSLPPGCVEDIMTRVDCNNILKGEEVQAEQEFMPGSKVEIQHPAYRGMVGIYHSSAKERVMILLGLLNRQVVVSLNRNSIKPL